MDKNRKETVLYRFTGGSDGYSPTGNLIEDASGNLYGTATLGGNPACKDGCGTVFKLDKGRKLTVLHAFDGADGDQPQDLEPDAKGFLYGVTALGGSRNWGTVFKLSR